MKLSRKDLRNLIVEISDDLEQMVTDLQRAGVEASTERFKIRRKKDLEQDLTWMNADLNSKKYRINYLISVLNDYESYLEDRSFLKKINPTLIMTPESIQQEIKLLESSIPTLEKKRLAAEQALVSLGGDPRNIDITYDD